ncbi:MAG TPA: ribonuclease P protein component [Planctomycetia bacterium]|nr:ribonuclease P protein component [Planctomycetia bacterium]
MTPARPVARPFGFPRGFRLRSDREIDLVFKARNSASGARLVIFGRPNGLSWNRLGLSIGRKFGGAPVRNRFKRLCREAFRLMQAGRDGGWDWMVLPQKLKSEGKKSKRKATPRYSRVPWKLGEIQGEMADLMDRIARRPSRTERSS